MNRHGLWHLETSLHPLRQCSILRRPESRLWFLSAIGLLETSLLWLRTIRFFWCPGCRKCVRIFFRPFQTSLHGLHHSRI
jgi:hypothetical protein